MWEKDPGFTALAAEIEAALLAQNPGKDVTAIAKCLLSALRKNGAADILLITNGLKTGG